MKNSIAQIQLLVSRIDRRHLQLAFFALALFLKTMAPSDGGGGPF